MGTGSGTGLPSSDSLGDSTRGQEEPRHRPPPVHLEGSLHRPLASGLHATCSLSRPWGPWVSVQNCLLPQCPLGPPAGQRPSQLTPVWPWPRVRRCSESHWPRHSPGVHAAQRLSPLFPSRDMASWPGGRCVPLPGRSWGSASFVQGPVCGVAGPLCWGHSLSVGDTSLWRQTVTRP